MYATPTGYEILSLTGHYRRIGSRWYRDAIARRPDGALRLIAIPEV